MKKKLLVKILFFAVMAGLFVSSGTLEAKSRTKNGTKTPVIKAVTRNPKKKGIEVKLKKKVKGAKGYKIEWIAAGTKRIVSQKKVNQPDGDSSLLFYPGEWSDQGVDMEKVNSVVSDNPSLVKVELLLKYRQYDHVYGTDGKTGGEWHLRSVLQNPVWRVETAANQEGEAFVTITGEDENGKTVTKKQRVLVSKTNSHSQKAATDFVNRWIQVYIKPGMSEKDKVQAVFGYLKRLSYSSEKSDIFSDLLMPGETRTVKGGTCLSGAQFAVHVWHRLGVKAFVRNAILAKYDGRIPAHANTFVWVDGKRYIAETEPGDMAGSQFELRPEEKDVEGGFTKEEYADILLMQDVWDGKISYEEGPRNKEPEIRKYENYVQYNLQNGLTKKELTLEYNNIVETEEIGVSTFIEFCVNTIWFDGGTLNCNTTSGDSSLLTKMWYTEAGYTVMGTGTTQLLFQDCKGALCQYNVTIKDGGKSNNEITMDMSDKYMLRLGNGSVCEEIISSSCSDESLLVPQNDGRQTYRACGTGTATVTYQLKSGRELSLIVHII